ncbi:hypothetical protein KY346_05845 [Candidatus Woesearchaeota archaeon]|nr:hypothetical protein [Candidatus Woesearchaeota archaeon]
MINTITGNEDQPDDGKLPKINLAELREKKRQILQRNYAQNNAQNGDSGKPIDLSEIRQKKRQIQKQNKLEEEIVLPFTVPRPEDEEDQTLPFSIDREAEEEIVLPFTVPRPDQEEAIFPFIVTRKDKIQPAATPAKKDEEEAIFPFIVTRKDEEQTLPFSVSGPENGNSLQDAVAGTYGKNEYFSKLEKASNDRFEYFITDEKETKIVMKGDSLILLRGKYEFNVVDFKGIADPAVQSKEAFKNLVQKIYETIVEQRKEPLLAKYLPSLIEWGVLEDKETGESLAGWYLMQKNDE